VSSTQESISQTRRTSPETTPAAETQRLLAYIDGEINRFTNYLRLLSLFNDNSHAKKAYYEGRIEELQRFRDLISSASSSR
jgi:hypothetical protein